MTVDKHVPPREHPLWPVFRQWADAHVPNQMLEVYWLAFLEGARWGKHPPPVSHAPVLVLNDCRPAPAAPREEV